MSLIAHTGKQSVGANYSTTAIDTRGARLLVIAFTYDTPTGLPTVTDSAGNTWQSLTARVGTRHTLLIRYVINPITSSAHTWSVSTGGSNGSFGSLVALAFNDPVTAFDVQNGFGQSTTGNTTIQPGSITPAQPTLAVAAWGLDDPANTSWTVNSGFTISDIEDGIPGSTYGCVGAYIDPTAVGAVNPTFTRSNANTTGSDTAAIASFLLASGGTWPSQTRQAPGQRGPFDPRGFLKSPFLQYSFAPTGGALNNYTLPAAQGTFTLTGLAANLLEGHVLSASKGTFVVTGVAANLLEGRVVSASTGTFTLTGVAANLLEGHVLSAAKGTFVLNGVAANLLEGRVVTAAPGTFVLNGIAAGLSKGRTLTTAPATFALTGVSANLLDAHVLGAAPATFALAGRDAILVAPGSAPAVGGGGSPRKPFHGGLVYLQRLLKPLETKVLKKLKKKRRETLAVHNETQRLEAGVMPLAQLAQLEERAEAAEFEEEFTMLLMLLDD